ncbi:hypothetical protein D322_2666 [Yersinia enterocolitica IP 10393]|nr:hypothetical protein D322_2666 [Yersinia enterocolitica IP 10393]
MCVKYSTAIELFFVHGRDHKKQRKSENLSFYAQFLAQKSMFRSFTAHPHWP